jgi:hypothetical protein
MLAVEDLVGASGQGILALKKEKGEADPAEAGAVPVAGSEAAKRGGIKLSSDSTGKGYFFIGVTGVVPLRKQRAEYDETFVSAVEYRQDEDVPVYAGMRVERAEIDPAAPDKLAWQEIDLAGVGEFMSKWAMSDKEAVADVVNPEFTDGILTMPLGPLMGRDWSPSLVGHPKIPSADRLDPSKKPEKEVPPPPKDTSFAWGARPSGRAGAPAQKPAPVASTSTSKTGPSAPNVDQKLFRFVDYTVEPGKQYCYRVKLVLNNPNYEKAERFLKDPESAKLPVLETDWSAPTAPIGVSPGVRVLAGPVVKLVDKHDPIVKICIITFDRQRGGEPAGDEPVERGVLANFIEDTLWVLTPDLSKKAEWKDVDLQSNVLIVDLLGGRKLNQPRNKKDTMVEPVEMLLLDPEGNLRVHDELDDADEFHARLDPLTSTGPKEKPATSSASPAAGGGDKNPYSGGGSDKPAPKPRRARAAN